MKETIKDDTSEKNVLLFSGISVFPHFFSPSQPYLTLSEHTGWKNTAPKWSEKQNCVFASTMEETFSWESVPVRDQNLFSSPSNSLSCLSCQATKRLRSELQLWSNSQVTEAREAAVGNRRLTRVHHWLYITNIILLLSTLLSLSIKRT